MKSIISVGDISNIKKNRDKKLSKTRPNKYKKGFAFFDVSDSKISLEQFFRLFPAMLNDQCLYVCIVRIKRF